MRLLSHACTARPGGVVAVSCHRPDPLSSAAAVPGPLPGAVGTATGNRRPAHRPAVDERRRLRPYPPPHHRPTRTVMPHLPNLIRRLRPSPPVLHRVGRARSDYMPSERRGARRARAGYDHLGRGLGLAGQAAGLQCYSRGQMHVHYCSLFF
jgi:hypothetical protein